MLFLGTIEQKKFISSNDITYNDTLNELCIMTRLLNLTQQLQFLRM